MNGNLIWILILITKCAYVASRPADTKHGIKDNNPNYGAANHHNDEQVISVRITSSVAVGRGRVKHAHNDENNSSKTTKTTPDEHNDEESKMDMQNNEDTAPPHLKGANIEFIKQLNAKKELKEPDFSHQLHYKTPEDKYNENNDKDKTMAELNNKQLIDVTTTTTDATTFVTNPESLQESNEFHSSSLLDDALKLSETRLNPNTAEQINADNSRSAEFVTSFTVGDLSRTEENIDIQNNNDTDDSIAESSIKSVLEIINKNENNYENSENVPLARSLLQSPSSKNYIQGFTNKPPSEREPNTRLTTVSFNVVHDPPSSSSVYNDPNMGQINPSQTYNEQQKFYETQKIYSQPAQIYSEPAKFYSEPAKIYSEPAKIYSEPAKFYSEPAKIYSEPAKFYSEPASLHLELNGPQNYMPWRQQSQLPDTTTLNTTPLTTITFPGVTNPQSVPEHQPEKNYEIDEKVSVMTDGRSHGIQETSTEKCKQDNCKVGYVVKGREYNKYRVEERTSDGYIVGEYGVVRNEDGALRGVRYTADSEASPRLIYDALMKFLQLK